MAEVRSGIDDVVTQLRSRLDTLPPALAFRRPFLQTYLRTTEAVGVAVRDGAFEDPDWVARWDVVFADYFLAAHDTDLAGEPVCRPWRLAFGAPPAEHPLLHLLLGLNAHINYDLPQAMVDVISVEDFANPVLLRSRERDHDRIDHVLASRVAAEDQALGGPRRVRDRVLTPLNRLSSQRFLRESRRAVWGNVLALHEARLAGPDTYRSRVGELEVLCAARIADLLRPGLVLIRLAVNGFGVRLPPP